jgi:hypothetical protein
MAEATPVLDAFFTGGFCSGPCNGDLKVTRAPSGGIREALLTLQEQGSDAVAVQNSAVLTASGARLVETLVTRLVDTQLLAQYKGCGAACDGFTVTLRVETVPGSAQAPTIQTVYADGELQDAPVELRLTVNLIDSMKRSLTRCRSNEHLVVSEGCTAAPGW